MWNLWSPLDAVERLQQQKHTRTRTFSPDCWNYLFNLIIVYREFANLLAMAFLALRKHVAYLIWVLTQVGTELGLPTARVSGLQNLFVFVVDVRRNSNYQYTASSSF